MPIAGTITGGEDRVVEYCSPVFAAVVLLQPRLTPTAEEVDDAAEVLERAIFDISSYNANLWIR